MDKTGCYMLLDQEDANVENSEERSMAKYFDDGHHTLLTVSWAV